MNEEKELIGVEKWIHIESGIPIASNNSLCRAQPLYLEGHCGYYMQAWHKYLKRDGTWLLERVGEEVWEMLFKYDYFTTDDDSLSELRVGAIATPPNLRVTRDSEGFTIFGPHYSVMAEAARYLNFSLRAFSIQDEDILNLAIRERFHFAISDLNPVLQSTLELCNNELIKRLIGIDPADFGFPPIGRFTKTVTVLDMDAILQGWSYKPLNPFRFLTAFEGVTWFLILVCGLLVAGRLFARAALIQTRHSIVVKLLTTLEFVFFSIFGCPELEILRRIPLYLTSWLTAVWLLQQYYGGDMLSALMEPPQLDVIDSIEELARSDKQVMIPSPDGWGLVDSDAVVRNYFKGYSEAVRGLAAQSELIDYLKVLQTEDRLLAFMDDWQTSKGKYHNKVGLGWRSWVLFVKNKFANEKFKEVFYVSKGGGDTQPNFYLSVLWANEMVRNRVDFVITHLTESGIFQRWVQWATYGREDFELPTAVVEYEDVSFFNLKYPFVLLAALLSLTIPILFKEKGVALAKEILMYLSSRSRVGALP